MFANGLYMRSVADAKQHQLNLKNKSKMKAQDNKKEKATDVYTLLPAVLDEIIEYIEDTEQTIDGEWGSCRDLKKLIRDKQMPELYDKLIALRNGR